MPLVSKTFADIITFTRASTANYFNSAGVLTNAAANEPRFDYNPSTLAAQGLLIEEARTNSIRNNTMVGAVAGTPGTAPTNWSIGGISGGLASQVVGTGTENGITYIDIRIFGTNSSGSSVFPGVFFDTTTGIAATTGQVWTSSLYLSLVAGTGISFESAIHEADSGGVFLRSTTLAGAGGVPTTGALNTRRRAGSATLGASTAFVRPLIACTVLNGASLDITLRIGLPQLEQGAFATSYIPTTTTALTRAADIASVNTLSPWYNASEGTLYAEVGSAPVNTILQVAYELNDNLGGGLGRISTRRSGAQTVSTAVTSGGVVQSDISVGTVIAAGATYKVASAFKTNDFAITNNGLTPVTFSSGTLPNTIAKLFLGQNYLGGQSLNGYLRRITYYPRKLSSAELQTLTT